MEMEGVESREFASENGEGDTMAVDTPKRIHRLSRMEWWMIEKTARS
jgi:hypothetical protein